MANSSSNLVVNLAKEIYILNASMKAILKNVKRAELHRRIISTTVCTNLFVAIIITKKRLIQIF